MTAPRLDWTVAEACDPAIADRAAYSPKADAPVLLVEIDRRAQIALAEERRLEAPTPAGRTGIFWGIIVTLAAAGALLATLGLARGRRELVLVGAALLIVDLAAARLLRPALGLVRHDAEVVQLVRCRLQLAEARALVQQRQLAACVEAVEEVDEDLLGWEGRVVGGTPVTVENIRHLREETRARR